jgi:hypothetical protein
MPKPSASLKAAIEPYQKALDSMKDLDVSMSNLRDKKSLLEKDMLSIDDRLATLDRERPMLLESVLAGAQPEAILTEQELEATRLKSERKSKVDLVELIEAQIQNKAAARTNINARLEPMRRGIFAVIQADLVATMPDGLMSYITKLGAVAPMNHQTWISILQGLMPERKHDDWEKERNRILADYVIPNP